METIEKFSRGARSLFLCLGLTVAGCAADGAVNDDTTAADDGSEQLADSDEVDVAEQALASSNPGTPTGKWSIGYYAAYQRSMLAPSEIDWSGLSHVVFTRLKTRGTGDVVRDFDIDTVNGPALAREVSTRAHQNGKKALLMLGGANEGWAIAQSANNTNRARFVSNLLQAVIDYGYDGLDLDWEDSLNYDVFIQLVKDLRASPKAPANLIITVPGFTINGNYQRVDPKLPGLINLVDQYTLMSYYPATAVAGYGWLSWHNSALTGSKGQTPVTIQDSLNRLVAAGVAKSKLSMGISFYAICYTSPVTAPNQSTENGVQIRGGDNDFPLSKLFGLGGAYNASYRRWDSAAQVPYLSLPTAESHGCRYVSFDDEQSIQAKGDFTKANGYGGIMVWTLNQGYLRNSNIKSPTALTQAIRRAFLQ